MAIRVIAEYLRPHRGNWRTHAWAMLALVAMLLFAPPGQAQSGSLEARVKAAFLFNFTKFVDWPPEAFASAEAPLNICVLGADPIGPILDETVHGKSVNSHPLVVQRVQPGPGMRGCRILYLSDLQSAEAREVTGMLRGQPVLTVSDVPGFLDAGGMIRFLIVDGKVRFEINHAATERARLTVSSQLLSVAHAVVRGPGS